jgi:hypothetical protein
MKIVQSFWTLPMLKGEKEVYNNRFAGGWLELKYYLLSWTYSCLLLKHFYKDVELVTDAAGSALLIEQLQLPYTKVDVVLDCLNQYNPEFWVMGKIHTFSMQETPFIHVDGDVFIWQRFPGRLEKAGLIAQNIEYDYPIYGEVFDWLIENNFYIPEVILENRDSGLPLHAYNAGIVGGNNIPFIREYVREFMKFVEINRKGLFGISSGLLNAFCEQHLYFCMTQKKKMPVECLMDGMDRVRLEFNLKSLEQFRNEPDGAKYIHLYGGDVKMNQAHCDELARRVKKEYPLYYQRINALRTLSHYVR